jgi:glycosyltransferase involved in cell wall biosynthesis
LNPWLYNKNYLNGLSTIKKAVISLGGSFARVLDRLSYEYAIKIIVPSNFVKTEVEKKYGRKIPVAIARSGVDIEFFNKINYSSLSEKYENDNVILHVASYLSPMKGTKYAIESLKVILSSFPNALLVILNHYDDVAEQVALMNMARTLSVDSRVRFVVGISDEEMVQYYSIAKVLLQPSLDENIHFPVLEAASCKCPSVEFSGTIECEDVINGNTGYIVDKYNSNDMGLMTVRILNDIALRDLLGENARKYISDNFLWSNCLEVFDDKSM